MKKRVLSLDEFTKKKTSINYEDCVSQSKTISNNVHINNSKESNNQDLAIDEKSLSIAQQRLFGMAHAVRKGILKREDAPKSVLGIVDSNMTDEQIKDFAETKHIGLPYRIS